MVRPCSIPIGRMALDRLLGTVVLGSRSGPARRQDPVGRARPSGCSATSRPASFGVRAGLLGGRSGGTVATPVAAPSTPPPSGRFLKPASYPSPADSGAVVRAKGYLCLTPHHRRARRRHHRAQVDTEIRTIAPLAGLTPRVVGWAHRSRRSLLTGGECRRLRADGQTPVVPPASPSAGPPDDPHVRNGAIADAVYVNRTGGGAPRRRRTFATSAGSTISPARRSRWPAYVDGVLAGRSDQPGDVHPAIFQYSRQRRRPLRPRRL